MTKQYMKLPTDELNSFVTMLFLHSALPGQTYITYSTVCKHGNVELASLTEQRSRKKVVCFMTFSFEVMYWMCMLSLNIESNDWSPFQYYCSQSFFQHSNLTS